MKTTADHSTHSATRAQRKSDSTPFFAPQRATEDRGVVAQEAFFQPKLTVGAPDDKFEREADRVADRVVQRLAQERAGPRVQRKSDGNARPGGLPSTQLSISRVQRQASPEAPKMAEPEIEEEPLQRKPIFESADEAGEVQRKCAACAAEEEAAVQPCAACDARGGITPKRVPDLQRVGDGGLAASDDFAGKLTSSKGGGAPLANDTRSSMESAIGADFSGVRVHTGHHAAGLSDQIGAQAFTHGSDVYFNSGKYDPGSMGGQHLLAHELTHTVQQGAVRRKPTDDSAAAITKTSDMADIQRTHYWTPVGLKKGVSGTAIHSEITKAVVKANTGSDREVAIPNADRDKNVGYGIKGQADFYKGTKIGLYFDQLAGTSVSKTLRGNGKASRPKASGGGVKQITQGPSDIRLGELKPADKDQIAFGENQLNSYEQGIEFARAQSNSWSNKQVPPGVAADQWPAISFSRFTDADLAIPADYQYDPNAPKTNINVGVGTYRGAGERVVLEFNPYQKLGKLVKGGLYAMHKPNGVVIYFARPADPAAAISGLDPASLQAAVAQHATTLQNEVIAPLVASPEKVQLKKIPGHQASPIQVKEQRTAASKPPVQRKAKRYRLKDNFKLPAWKKSREKVVDGFRGKKNSGLRDKTEFIKLMYESEAAITDLNVSKPPHNKRLPDKKKNAVDIPAPKSGGKKKHKNLPDLYDWLNVWTMPGMDLIGTVRRKFGGAFVRVAGRVNSLKIKLQDKVEKAKNRGSKSGFSYAKIAVRAFWRAAVKVGGLVFTKMTALLFASAEVGIKKNMDKIFPLSPAELQREVESGFPQLKELETSMDALELSVEAKIKAVQDKYDDDIKKLEGYAAAAAKYGPYIKWAVVALNCASPPGWGCLKLLAKGLIARLVDEVLQWCWTQEKFEGFVVATGIFDGVPNFLAGKVADGVETLLPGRILPLFDRDTLEKPADLSTGDIPCGEAPTAEQMALTDLHDELKNKLDDSGYEQLLRAMEKYGVKPDKPLTVDEIMAIKNNIPEGVTADMIRKYMEETPVPDKKKRQIIDIGTFLHRVVEADAKRSDFYFIAHPPRSGHTKYSTVNVQLSLSNNQSCGSWEGLQPMTIKARVTKRIWTSESKKLFKIYYEAKETITFSFNGKEQSITQGTEFWGYRPDVCSA